MHSNEDVGNGRVKRPASGYNYHGSVPMPCGTIYWQQLENGEVVLSGASMGGREKRSIGEMRLTAQEELQLVNALLAQYRPNAMPDSNAYYAASAVISSDGHLFLGVNNEVHIKDSFSGRGCGETSALRHCQDGLHREDVKISKVYLMSGMAVKQPDGSLIDKEPGHRGCMCGECRDNLRSHVSQDSVFIMLPTNDGTKQLRLNRTANYDHELRGDEAWSLSYSKQYPLPEKKEMPGPHVSRLVRDGYLYITNTQQAALPLETPVTKLLQEAGKGKVSLDPEQVQALLRAYAQVDFSVPALKVSPSLKNINRAMLQLIKKSYSEHAGHIPEDKNLKITVVLLKTENGDFYPGISVVGDGWITSKPPVIPNALSNAYGHVGFTDVYMMTFDNMQGTQEMSLGAEAGHALKMPDSGGLNRLIKSLRKGDNPKITVIPINDGLMSEEALQALCKDHILSAREAFGPDFRNNKTELRNARAH
jgi:cytidine deaminase